MDQQSQDIETAAQHQWDIEPAMQQMTDSMQQSFRTLADRVVQFQESNATLAQNFFQTFVEQLQNQGQGTQQATQDLRQAFERLTEESVNAYNDFLNSSLAFYQEALSSSTQAFQQGILSSSAQAFQQGRQSVEQTEQGLVFLEAARRIAKEHADALEELAKR